MRYLLGALLLLAAACAPPDGTGYAVEWGRTPIARAAPAGEGCAIATATGTGAVSFKGANNGGQILAFTMPLQVKLTFTSTAPVTLCGSQDPSPIINRLGRFSADSAGYYAAGAGACFPLQPPSDFWGVVPATFAPVGSTAAVGSKPWRCATSLTPCSVDSDCPSGGGACTDTTKSSKTYLFAIFEAGSGSSAIACDVR